MRDHTRSFALISHRQVHLLHCSSTCYRKRAKIGYLEFALKKAVRITYVVNANLTNKKTRAVVYKNII